MAFINITELNPRKTIVEFEYPALVEKGLERFLRTGTLYSKGVSTVITEEPFWWEAMHEYFKKGEPNRYVKHAGFPVVVIKETGPAVMVPLYTSPSGIGDYLDNRRNVWAAAEPVEESLENSPEETIDEKVKKINKELLTQYFKLKSFKKALDETNKNLDKALKMIEPNVKEELQGEMLEREFKINKEYLEELLKEVVSTLNKYEKILTKTFSRKVTRGGKPIINYEKAFQLLADRFKLTDQKRKEFIEMATTIPEKIEQVQTVTQTKLVKRESFLRFATNILKQIWEKIKGFFKSFRNVTKEAIDSIESLNKTLDLVLQEVE